MRTEIFGTKIRADFLFAALIFVMLWFDKRGISSMTLSAVFMHEAGHYAALALQKRRPKELYFTIFSLKMGTTRQFKGYFRDIIVSMSGPVVNLIAFTLIYLFGNPMDEKQLLFGIVNLVTGGFNLLPAGSLDGGQALNSFLCLYMSECKAQTLSFIISLAFIVPLGIAGLCVLLQSGHNITLLLICGYLTLSLFVKSV